MLASSVTTMIEASGAQQFLSISDLSIEDWLSVRDRVLGQVIANTEDRWPVEPTEDPVWGLIRIVIAQQIATSSACRIAATIRERYSHLAAGSPGPIFTAGELTQLGLPRLRAECCVQIAHCAGQLREQLADPDVRDGVLTAMRGIGPWTINVFRIMVLRHQDVLPLGDVGLNRALRRLYGEDAAIGAVSANWRPYRSVACWYLWRTLGNQQLG